MGGLGIEAENRVDFSKNNNLTEIVVFNNLTEIVVSNVFCQQITDFVSWNLKIGKKHHKTDQNGAK